MLKVVIIALMSQVLRDLSEQVYIPYSSEYLVLNTYFEPLWQQS